MSLQDSTGATRLSVVVPLYNEVESVPELHRRLVPILQGMGRPFEIIFVDDGSLDGTFSVMKTLSPLYAIRLRRNYGQTAALAAGIRQATGDVIVTMDGDLENDPADIPGLLQKIEQGYDIASGWRRGRWGDQPLSRRLPSYLANRFISWVSGVDLHDHGCQLKAYRRACLTPVDFTGDMHRMIAAYAAREGATVIELPVRFEKRKYGRSKYTMSRIFKVLLDVLAFHFFHRFSARPMHFFGGFGFTMLFFAALSFGTMLFLRFWLGVSFIVTPLPTLTVFLAIVAVQFILMGLLAEMLHRLLRRGNESTDDERIAEKTLNG